MTRTHATRIAAGLALIAALAGSVYAGRRLAESGASPACHGQALAWQGRVVGRRIPSSHPKLEASIVKAVNKFRVAHDEPALFVSLVLGYAARSHSQDEHDRGYFAHERAGSTFVLRLARYSPSVCIAENLAWGTGGFATGEGFVSLWRSSPGHRRVMLLPWVRRIGVGVVGGTFLGSRHARIVTADFAG